MTFGNPFFDNFQKHETGSENIFGKLRAVATL